METGVCRQHYSMNNRLILSVTATKLVLKVGINIWLQAVCCLDKIHCCKHGQKCDEKGGTCKGASNFTTPWQLKLPAQPVFEEQHLFDEVEV